ncbi:GFA family protein [Massilia sp. W12]|uniref:GFA family protein n=1 Tax=Massilia sp. W12 TaxID=3126507 RepID=UPI0030D51308
MSFAKALPPPDAPRIVRQAACSCGSLQASVQGEALRISICHCLACQRRTGSVFGMQARFARSDVSIQGAWRSWRRIGDSGSAIDFHFCPLCSATLFYICEEQPEVIAIPVGAFADPDFPPPRVSVYEERKHAWVGLPPEIERES